MKQGKFIVIDGSDGSGKKTQSDLLIANLKRDGYRTAYYDFPRYESFFGRMIGRYLNGEFGDVDEVNPYLIAITYAADRWQAAEQINKDLADGKIVVSNRYIQSNMAFSIAKLKTQAEKKKFLAWVGQMEYEIFKIPRADLVIYLYVPYQISQSLVDQKAARNYTQLKRDIHEKNSNYLARVEEEYVNLSKLYPEWRLIDCVGGGKILPRETIAKKVYEVVRKELEKK